MIKIMFKRIFLYICLFKYISSVLCAHTHIYVCSYILCISYWHKAADYFTFIVCFVDLLVRYENAIHNENLRPRSTTCIAGEISLAKLLSSISYVGSLLRTSRRARCCNRSTVMQSRIIRSQNAGVLN